MQIQSIQAASTYSLRHKILRPNQTIEDCKYPLDFDKDSFHIGAFDNDLIVGIASFFKESHERFNYADQYRLRGMATLEAIRGSGTGKQILQSGIAELHQRKAGLLWCNARSLVCGFYEKFGMQREGAEFDLPPIGMHYLMALDLKGS